MVMKMDDLFQVGYDKGWLSFCLFLEYSNIVDIKWIIILKMIKVIYLNIFMNKLKKGNDNNWNEYQKSFKITDKNE